MNLNDFKIEIDRRTDVLKENVHELSAIECGVTTCNYHFYALLAICGYPFKPKDWMNEEYIKPLISFDLYKEDNEYMQYVDEKHMEFIGYFLKHTTDFDDIEERMREAFPEDYKNA